MPIERFEWPWTFWDLHKVIGPLSDPASYGGDPSDAFDVIVPSLPGFGFSTPLQVSGINFWRTADLWHELTTKELGYPRFAAHGGDWGAIITSQLGYKYAQSLIGIHQVMTIPLTNFNSERPWDIAGGMMVPAGTPEDEREKLLKWQKAIAAHVAVHMLDPQTLGDRTQRFSGRLARLVDGATPCMGVLRRRSRRDLGQEFLITTAMIYWVTQSLGTSARFYAEAARSPWRPTHGEPVVQVPTGLSHMLGDGTRFPGPSDTSMFKNVIFERDHQRGGHFSASETPARSYKVLGRCSAS